MYFITICTKHRVPYFGEITETDNRPSLQETAIGKITRQFWFEIPAHYPFVILDEFTLMHDHLHGILIIDKPFTQEWATNKFGAQSQNIPAIIRAFKASVKRYANTNQIGFRWHTGYDDRIIRSEIDLCNTRQYIMNNIRNCASKDRQSSISIRAHHKCSLKNTNSLSLIESASNIAP